MNWIGAIIKLLPDGVLEEVNALSLEELDQRKLIFFADQDWSSYETTGEEILQHLGLSRKSKLILGAEGVGKTSTIQRIIDNFSQDDQIYALGLIEDLRVRELQLFSPQSVGNEDLNSLLYPIFAVYQIYLERLNSLATHQQVWLILEAWDSIWLSLQRLPRRDLELIQLMIAQLIYSGKKLGVGLIVECQSLDLDSLGGISAEQFKLLFDTYFQSFTQYSPIQYFLYFIYSKSEITSVEKEYSRLSNAIKVGLINQPVIISFSGRPQVGLVPKLEVEYATH